MANHKSALKRARQNENRRLRNRVRKTRMKSAIKQVRSAIAEGTRDNALRQLDTSRSIIDKAAKTGGIHRKTASRKISRLARQINKLSS